LRVLVVCTANICRSPYGAAVLQHFLGNAADAVSSAGIHAETGKAADSSMIRLAQERGFGDLSQHRSRLALSGVVSSSDLVLCMETAHVGALLRNYPTMTGRIRLFADRPPRDVRDPTGLQESNYLEAAAEIEGLAKQWAERIQRLR
jgi:protein-tyrosine phosphatase